MMRHRIGKPLVSIVRGREQVDHAAAMPAMQRAARMVQPGERSGRLGLAATVDLERAVRGGSAQPVAEREFRRIGAGAGIGQQRLRAGEKLHAQRVGVPVSTAPPAMRTSVDYQQRSFGRSRHRVVAAGGKGHRLRWRAWSVERVKPLRAFRTKQPPCFFGKVAADVLELRAVEQNRGHRQRIEQLGGMIARRIENRPPSSSPNRGAQPVCEIPCNAPCHALDGRVQLR